MRRRCVINLVPRIAPKNCLISRNFSRYLQIPLEPLSTLGDASKFKIDRPWCEAVAAVNRRTDPFSPLSGPFSAESTHGRGWGGGIWFAALGPSAPLRPSRRRWRRGSATGIGGCGCWPARPSPPPYPPARGTPPPASRPRGPQGRQDGGGRCLERNLAEHLRRPPAHDSTPPENP